MDSVRDKLVNMFSKIMAGTVTREEGTMLINHLAKEDLAETMKELSSLIDTPPSGVFPKTILHTVALTRNKAFYNIMVASLEHKNEDVSILAAQELGKLRTAEARDVLVEHLTSEAYHVRKASALALAQGFAEGAEILKKNLLTHPEPFFRATSANALAQGGRKGLDTLLSVLASGNAGAVMTAAEALVGVSRNLSDEDIQKVFGALMHAGDRKDSPSIVEILKLVGSLGGRASRFEGYVVAFTDYPFEQVRGEAGAALRSIRGVSRR